MIIQVIFNVAGTRIVAALNDISVYWHIFFVGAIFICLLFLGSLPTNPLSFPFQVAPGGAVGDSPIATIVPLGVLGAFLFSLLQSQWTYTGYDASAHVAEETVGARLVVGLGRVPVGRRLGDRGLRRAHGARAEDAAVADVLANSPGGYARALHPVPNLGEGFALGGLLSAGVAIAMTLCGFSSIASASRMLFAFSRDDGVPAASGSSRSATGIGRRPTP